MQTVQETHRCLRDTRSLTIQHKPGLLDPNCCKIHLCWWVAVVSGGQGSLLEVAVIKMQWESQAASSDKGTIGGAVLWSHLGYTVQWTVMEINVHWGKGLIDQSKQQWLVTKKARRGDGKDALWSLTHFLCEHTGDTPWVLPEILNCGKNPRNMADTWNMPTWHPSSTMRFIKTHMHMASSPPHYCQSGIEVWYKVIGFL